MNILVTGATGFIGHYFCREAVQRGHRLLALTRSPEWPDMPGIEIAPGSLAKTPWSQIQRFAPDAVLHLAWIAKPGVYLHTEENTLRLEQSKIWFQKLSALGAPYLAGVGTCIEYAASTQPLHEDSSPLSPQFAYTRAKVALFEWLRDHVAEESWTWTRIFYPYGPGEHPARITSLFMDALRNCKPCSLRTPQSVKDFIHVQDVATALCTVLEKRPAGAVNIGTGIGTEIETVARQIAAHLRADSTLVTYDAQPALDPTPIVIADASRLRALGWEPAFDLKAGLQQFIDNARPKS